MPDYALEDPSNLLLGQPDGTFVEGAEAAGIVDFARAPRCGPRRPQPRRLLDLVAVDRRENVRLWRNVGLGHGRRTGADGQLARRCDLEQPGPNRDAIGAWVEVRVGERVIGAS